MALPLLAKRAEFLAAAGSSSNNFLTFAKVPQKIHYPRIGTRETAEGSQSGAYTAAGPKGLEPLSNAAQDLGAAKIVSGTPCTAALAAAGAGVAKGAESGCNVEPVLHKCNNGRPGSVPQRAFCSDESFGGPHRQKVQRRQQPDLDWAPPAHLGPQEGTLPVSTSIETIPYRLRSSPSELFRRLPSGMHAANLSVMGFCAQPSTAIPDAAAASAAAPTPTFASKEVPQQGPQTGAGNAAATPGWLWHVQQLQQQQLLQHPQVLQQTPRPLLSPMPTTRPLNHRS